MISAINLHLLRMYQTTVAIGHGKKFNYFSALHIAPLAPQHQQQHLVPLPPIRFD
jgi:hypothetical protein